MEQQEVLQLIEETGLDGTGVKTLTIDTGLPDHDDLKVVDYYNATDDSLALDGNGHSTHVLGIQSALNNQIFTQGGAYNADAYICKALKDSGSGAFRWVEDCIKYGKSKGVKVVNLSLGASSAPQSLYDEIHSAIDDYNMIFVCAAGNVGNSGVGAPAKDERVLAVGSTNQRGEVSSFSSRGVELDVVAPGEQIISSYKGNRKAKLSGTSMASPYVAMVAAMMCQREPDLTQAEFNKRVTETATDKGERGFDINYGHGEINTRALLTYDIGEQPDPDNPDDQPNNPDEPVDPDDPKEEPETPDDPKEEPDNPDDPKKPSRKFLLLSLVAVGIFIGIFLLMRKSKE